MSSYGTSEDPGVQHAAGQIAVAIVAYVHAATPDLIDLDADHGPRVLIEASTLVAQRLRRGTLGKLAGQEMMGVDLGEAGLEILHEVDSIIRGGVGLAKQFRDARPPE